MKVAFFLAFMVLTGVAMCNKEVGDKKFNCLASIASAEEGTAEELSGYAHQTAVLDNVNEMILYYKGLSAEHRKEIDACKLNLAPALKRCQQVHGKDSCEKVTSTFVNKKCKSGFRIEGCCQCVYKCPGNWKDDGYWCHKPEAKPAVGAACPEHFEKVGRTELCVAKCPLGWNDQGWRCMKPGTYHVGHPFMWVAGDN